MTDYYFTGVIGNLQKAQRGWARMSRIMGKEGTYALTLGNLYLSISHSIMVFGLEIGFITPPHLEGPGRGFPPPGRMIFGRGGGVKHGNERMGTRITPHWGGK